MVINCTAVNEMQVGGIEQVQHSTASNVHFVVKDPGDKGSEFSYDI